MYTRPTKVWSRKIASSVRAMTTGISMYHGAGFFSDSPVVFSESVTGTELSSRWRAYTCTT